MNTERRILTLVMTGLFLIVATTFASWFFTHFERVKEVSSVGYSPEARRNRLLAAEHFLRRVGIEAESVAGRRLLDDLPSMKDTLVVLRPGPLNEERRAALRAWVESGGRLVVEAANIWDESTSRKDFLEDLGVRLAKVDAEDRLAQDEVKIASPDLPRTLTVAFASAYQLELSSDLSTNAAKEAVFDDRTHSMRLSLGAGILTVLSDSAFMSNDRIDDHDHALFFARLVAPPNGGKVWLIYDGSVPWFGALLWSAAPAALVSGALLVGFWAWALGARLGPLQGVPDRRRRDLLEHLDACADFQWRNDHAADVVASSTQRVLSTWLKRHPNLAQAYRHEHVAAAAEATGESVETMTRALFARSETVSEFIAQGLLLQRLWRATPGDPVKRQRRKQRIAGESLHSIDSTQN